MDEGSSYTLNLSSFDPGADTISQWNINWGDSTQVVSGNPLSVSPAASLIQRHSHAAHILAIVFVLFTASLILTFAAQRISGGMPTGLAIADRLLSPRMNVVALRVALVILALVSAYMVFKVGDLGAKAVWAGRLRQSVPPG